MVAVGEEISLLFQLQEAELKVTLGRSKKSLAEAEMQWMHLILVQMAYKFGWKSPWCTKLVCRKHEGIPLHYKNITKHEKARTGVIVHLSSLRRGEQYCYINLVKKVSGLPEKHSEILRCLTITILQLLCHDLLPTVSLTCFSTSRKSEITLTLD